MVRTTNSSTIDHQNKKEKLTAECNERKENRNVIYSNLVKNTKMSMIITFDPVLETK